MSRTSNSLRKVLAGAVCLAAAVVFVSLAGCGGEDSGDTGYRTVRKDTTPPATVTAVEESSGDAGVAAVEAAPKVQGEEENDVKDFEEVTYDEAEAAYLAGDYAEATEMFTAYTERRAENPWGYYMLGLSAWKAGDFEKSEGAFKLALDLDPDHLKSHVNLARVYLDAGDPEAALACAQRAGEIEPGSGVAVRLEGRALHQLGRAPEAVDAYRRALVLDPSDAWSMNNMALILIEQEKFDEALAPLARAVELKQDVAVFHNNLGMALERCGYYRAAEKAYDTALTIEFYEKPSINFERISQVDEQAGLGPIDLAALSREFASEIEAWAMAASAAVPLAGIVDTLSAPLAEAPATSEENDSTYAGREDR